MFLQRFERNKHVALWESGEARASDVHGRLHLNKHVKYV